MKAVILLHVDHEGPGTLGTFLEEAGAEIRTIRLHRGEPLPTDPGEADLFVSMGGPMNVYEDDAYPFLASETDFLREVVEADFPVLGICLGAQVIARACGARVYTAPVKEVGWRTVDLTAEGKLDRIFRGLPAAIPVLQWHEDTFDVPEGGELLATSVACPNQAFRMRRAYGLQFHIEVDRRMLEEWFSTSPQKQDTLSSYDRIREDFDHLARRLYGNFTALAGGGKKEDRAFDSAANV